MSEFYVRDSELKNYASTLKGDSGKMNRLAAGIRTTSLLNDLYDLDKGNITRNLKSLSASMQENGRTMEKMGTTLGNIANMYRKAEIYAIESANGREYITIGEYFSDYINGMGPLEWLIQTIPGVSAVSALQIFRNWWNDSNISHFGWEAKGLKTTDHSYSGSFDFKSYYSKYENRSTGMARKLSRIGSKLNKLNKKGKFKRSNGKPILDAKGKWINGKKVNPNNKKAMKEFEDLTDQRLLDGVDVNIASVGVKTENSLWRSGEGVIGDKDGTHLSGEVRLLNADAEASAYIGLGCIGASAGASVSVLHMEGEAQAGNDMLGVYAKGEVDVLKAGLEGDVSVGLYDKDGKFNPSVHAGVSAEAIAAEASVKGGVKIAGTDVGVKAGVNVGLGAHADIGLKDGKFTADLGASLGVGVSLKVEVDVSGTVDAVAGAAKSVLDGAGKAVDNIGKNIGKGISKLFKW